MPQRKRRPCSPHTLRVFSSFIGAQLEETSRGIRSIHHFAPCIGKQRCYRPAVDFFIELVDALGRGKVRLDRYPLFHLRAEVDPPRFRVSDLLAAISRSNSFLAHSLASSNPIPVEAPVTTASLRCDSGIGCLLHARLQYDLDAAVLLVTECLVKLRPLLSRWRKSVLPSRRRETRINRQRKKVARALCRSEAIRLDHLMPIG